MAEKARQEFTAAAGRQFGFTVGAAFLVFGGIAWWRGHPTTSTVLAALGVALLAAGLLLPVALGPVERAWMALARVLSKVTTPIVMGVIYLIVFSSVGIIRRTLARNPLAHAEASRGFWKERAKGARRSASMQQQF